MKIWGLAHQRYAARDENGLNIPMSARTMHACMPACMHVSVIILNVYKLIIKNVSSWIGSWCLKLIKDSSNDADLKGACAII